MNSEEITPETAAAAPVPVPRQSRPRRPSRARLHLRLSAAERSELESAARAAGYAKLSAYLIDLARGETSARTQTDAMLAQVRAIVEGVVSAQAEKTAADMAALAESMDRLREQIKANYGALAARLPSAPGRPAGSGATSAVSGGER